MAKENVDYKLVEIIVDFDKWWGIELLKPPNEGLVIRYDKVGMHEEGEDKGIGGVTQAKTKTIRLNHFF